MLHSVSNRKVCQRCGHFAEEGLPTLLNGSFAQLGGMTMKFISTVLLAVLCLPLPLLAPPRLAFADGGNTVPTTSAEMSRHIDRLIEEHWAEEGRKPVTPVSDAEFLRRAYLDLTGVIPTVAEARAFLDERHSDKRAKLIERVLNSPGYATHMATTWRNRMLPSNFDPAMLQNAAGLQNWLRDQFIDNCRYDNLVGDLLSATGVGDRDPGVFYTALKSKPEKIAASTSRIFLGLQMECAQCHNHPYDDWTQ